MYTGGRALKDSSEYLRDFAHLVASHTERRDRGSTEPQSARVHGPLVSSGTTLRFNVIPAARHADSACRPLRPK